jgi:predicted amidophosphoribosyltransferase
MKQVIPARTLEDGTVEPTHEVDVVCSHCKDPVSDVEEVTGVCTACGQPWAPSQSVNVFASSLPAINTAVFKFI